MRKKKLALSLPDLSWLVGLIPTLRQILDIVEQLAGGLTKSQAKRIRSMALGGNWMGILQLIMQLLKQFGS